MFRERGGSSTFARHAFNELIAFIAGWAILIDYLIVIALAAISVPHYLEPIWGGFSSPGWEIGIAAAVIAAACVLNILNVTGRERQRSLAFLALADLGLQLAVIVVGALVVMHPDRLTEQLHLFSDPSFKDIVYASVVAMLAYAGIEAASDLAPDIDVSRRDLKRIASLGAIAVPLVYAGMAAIALMAVPVVAGPDGPQTALGNQLRRGAGAGGRLGLPPGLGRRLDALDGGADRRPGPLLGRQHLDARRLPPHLHAGDQPPDPQLAGQAREAPGDALRGDHDLRRHRPRPGDPDQRQAAGRDLRLRRDAGDHDRPPLDHPPADRAARSPAAVPDPDRDSLARSGVAAAGDHRRHSQRPRLRQRPRLPRHRPLGRRRLDGLRADLLRRSTARGSRGRR